jgi:hypothetical protein
MRDWAPNWSSSREELLSSIRSRVFYWCLLTGCLRGRATMQEALFEGMMFSLNEVSSVLRHKWDCSSKN